MRHARSFISGTGLVVPSIPPNKPPVNNGPRHHSALSVDAQALSRRPFPARAGHSTDARPQESAPEEVAVEGTGSEEDAQTGGQVGGRHSGRHSFHSSIKLFRNLKNYGFP